jgi:lipopolysaccharide transport protein LptA
MARLHTNLAVPLALLLGALTAAPLPAAIGDQPIDVKAASSDFDYKTGTVVLNKVIITEGNLRLQADTAHAIGQTTGLNFSDSRWVFQGNVRMDAAPSGNLRADEAVVDFKNSHIARATITGKPAEFEQKRVATDQLARGHANQIVYDLSDGSVHLSQDAWLSDGQNEISGPLLVYNIKAQRVQAASASGSAPGALPTPGATPGAAPGAIPGSDQRVHIIIKPHSAPADGPGAQPQTPETPQPASSPQP